MVLRTRTAIYLLTPIKRKVLPEMRVTRVMRVIRVSSKLAAFHNAPAQARLVAKQHKRTFAGPRRGPC